MSQAGASDRLLARVVAQRAQRSRGVDHRGRPDLGEIVIVRGHPEHGHHRPAAPRLELPGHHHGAERFPQHEERTAEETRLLSGDDRGRARRRQPRRALRGFLRSPGLLLAGQRLGHGRPIRVAHRLGGRGDRVRLESARPKERGDLRPARQVVEEERAQRLLQRLIGDDVHRAAHGHLERSTRERPREDNIAASPSQG